LWRKRKKEANQEKEISLLRTTIKALFDVSNHYEYPQGIKGYIAGKRMAEQHRPENLWTAGLLDTQPTDHVLEIGFGPGLALEYLAPQLASGRLMGIDSSSMMVWMASWRNRNAIRSGHVSLQRAHAASLPFGDASFDKIYSIHSLYFWPDPVLVVGEMIRILKPGGMICLTFMAREQWPGGGTGDEKCHVYSGEDVGELLLRGGCAHIRIDKGPVDKQFREIAVLGYK
jgi:SAM-dependent methyltransferase